MEKTATIDEDDNVENDEKTIGGKSNKRIAVLAFKPGKSRSRKTKNCRRRNILQRDESIRKEEVRGIIQINVTFPPFL